MERKKNAFNYFFNVQFNGIVKCNSGSCVECVSRCVGKLCSISVNIFAKGNKSARCARERTYGCGCGWNISKWNIILSVIGHDSIHINIRTSIHILHTYTHRARKRDARVVKSVTTQFGYKIANSLRHSMCFSYERCVLFSIYTMQCIPIDGNYISEREHPHYVNSVIYIGNSTCVVCVIYFRYNVVCFCFIACVCVYQVVCACTGNSWYWLISNFS